LGCSIPLSCSTSSVAPTITVCQNVDVGVSTYNPPVCGTAVYFQYNFAFPWAPSGLGAIPLTGKAVSRTEQ